MFIFSGLYLIWFYIQKCIVDLLKNYVSPIVGLTYGMILLEAHTLCKAAWYTIYKYRGNPLTYGFNAIHSEHRPVLLLHGAVGSWSYLGDLAASLQQAKFSVFVLNHGFGLPSDEIRRKVFEKIDEIRCLTNNQLSVDLVAHSNGGNLAFCSAFTEQCSFIDHQGKLQFRDEPQANPHIGKIITVALPTNEKEFELMCRINKENDLFNINAQYDGLMSHKICALSSDRRRDVNAAHIGIVFQTNAHEHIVEFLSK